MLSYWASNSLLLCWAFLLPCIVNFVTGLACCYVDGSRFSWLMPVIVVSGVATQIATLCLVAKLGLMAMAMEVTAYEQVMHAAYLVAGVVMFFRSLYMLARVLGEWGNDDMDEDDDEPDPEPPLPVGPQTGVTLQTSSSHRLLN